MNQIVDIDTFATELWGGAPPRTAVTTIRTHVYHLRRMLESESGMPGAGDALHTDSPGYRLCLEPEQLDTTRFTRLVAAGRGQLHAGRPEEAARTLQSALDLWCQPALANVSPGRVLSLHLIELNELRTRAHELRIEADLALGRHRELVAELRGLVAANPLNEWLQTQLIDSLRRSGRRDEALAAFRNFRQVLHEELGVEPSPELQQLHRDILTAATPAPSWRSPAGAAA
jgi:DNA-binding SARP family transcriptional activator